jgi:DNA-binding Xre family transcriptional regulator
MSLRSWLYFSDFGLISSSRKRCVCCLGSFIKQEEQAMTANQVCVFNEDQPLELWFQLLAEQRAILKFVRRAGDNVLTYALIAANMTIPRLPGDDKSEIISDRSIAKYCHILECPPWELIQRPGKRSGIQLSAKGACLMRLLANAKI